MGITRTSLDRIDRHIKQPGKLLVLGCQNIYDMEHYGQVAHQYFESLGFTVSSWDLLGCQGSETVDLRDDLQLQPEYDYIFQHGTIEHIDGPIYQAFKNIHEACKVGGIIIHENPLTGNWPGHGLHYFTTEFYIYFAGACGYTILENTTEASMGNYVDGWNVSCVLQKNSDSDFISEDSFNEFYGKFIFKK